MRLVDERDAGWVRFWECYPRREAKLDARKAWAQLAPDAPLVEAIIHALGWQRQTDQWLRGFVPLPASYLRGQRWTDEPPPMKLQQLVSEKTARTLTSGAAFVAGGE